MKKLLIGLLAIASSSAFAQIQEVTLIRCQSEIEINRFRSIDQTTQDYIVRTRGVRCVPEGRQQCQQQQVDTSKRQNQIDIDETTTILPGEAKLFKNKLIICQ